MFDRRPALTLISNKNPFVGNYEEGGCGVIIYSEDNEYLPAWNRMR
jgi:hypothetical protein